MPLLETPRLVLHPLREDDAADMAEVLADPRLYEFTGGAPPSADDLRTRYARLAAGPGRPDEQWLNWIVRCRDTGQSVGTVQATVTGRSAWVAWVIGVPWQGRAYATESAAAVIDWLAGTGVNDVKASIRPGHRASERVAERNGLTPTETEIDGERVWRRPANPQAEGGR
jgi:RimJ/RimL family protein N-acetyltransferase